MSAEASNWLRVVHVVGFVLWTGGMLTCIQLLRAHSHADAGARGALESTEKTTAILMDAGALLAIAAGFYLAFGQPYNPFKTGGWLHAKLTLVALGMIVLHVVVRRKIRLFRNGQVAPVSGALVPVLIGLIVAIVALPLARPF